MLQLGFYRTGYIPTYARNKICPIFSFEMGLYELFFGKVYTALKASCALAGGVTGISLFVVGTIGSQPVLYVLGGVNLVQCAFLIFDESQVIQQVKRQLQLMSLENKFYSENNQKLTSSLKELEDQNKKVSLINERLSVTVDDLETQNKNEEILNKKLEESLKLLKEQNENFKDHSEELAKKVEQLDKENAQMTAQVEKLKTLHEDSKKLLLKLMDAGDAFTSFNAIMSNNMDRLEGTSSDLQETSETMKMLIEAMEYQKFSELDTNGDGIVSKEEWQDYFNRRKKKDIN